jgi:hypothetical protein
MYTYVCVCVYLHVIIYTYIHTYMHACMHIYTYVCIYTYNISSVKTWVEFRSVIRGHIAARNLFSPHRVGVLLMSVFYYTLHVSTGYHGKNIRNLKKNCPGLYMAVVFTLHIIFVHFRHSGSIQVPLLSGPRVCESKFLHTQRYVYVYIYIYVYVGGVY